MRSKYSNQFEVVDGVKFRSRAEARRYRQLKLLERAGTIRGLKLQVRYPLNVNGQKITVYAADFVYTEITDNPRSVGERLVVEDVKGVRTRDYVIKAKLLKALYGLTITETRA